MRRLLVITALLLGLLNLPCTAFASSTVEYDGSDGSFLYLNSDGEASSDLFESFKGVMPGDVLYETITIVNAKDSPTPERLYLKSAGQTATEEELLEELILTVYLQDGEELFVVNGSHSTNADEWCELGVVAPGGSVTLTVELEVPIELDTHFQSTSVQISSESLVWSFGAQEVSREEYEALLAGESSDEDSDDDSSIATVWSSDDDDTSQSSVVKKIANAVSDVYAKTSDHLCLAMLIVLVLMALGIILLVCSNRRSKKRTR